jgi:delta-aminolevulinic acid dehydratase/porphobilinogen synthase
MPAGVDGGGDVVEGAPSTQVARTHGSASADDGGVVVAVAAAVDGVLVAVRNRLGQKRASLGIVLSL